MSQTLRHVVRLAVVLVALPAHSEARQPPPPTFNLPAEGIVVPIVALTPLPVIEVRVNGKGPFKFAIDTGARGHARADISLVKALGLARAGGVTAGDGAGRTAAMNLVQLDTIEIGGVVIRDLRAPSRDYNGPRTEGRIDGILAFDLFANYLLTIDFPKRQLRVAAGALPEPDGKRVHAYQPFRGGISLPISVGDVTLQAHIDTGFSSAFTLPLSLASKMPLGAAPVVSGRYQLAASQFTQSTAAVVGPVRFAGWDVRIATLDFWDIYEHANVGSLVLGQFAITIDQQQQRIRLDRADDGPVIVTPVKR
jgi:predicted aspartyl protease